MKTELFKRPNSPIIRAAPLCLQPNLNQKVPVCFDDLMCPSMFQPQKILWWQFKMTEFFLLFLLNLGRTDLEFSTCGSQKMGHELLYKLTLMGRFGKGCSETSRFDQELLDFVPGPPQTERSRWNNQFRRISLEIKDAFATDIWDFKKSALVSKWKMHFPFPNGRGVAESNPFSSANIEISF